MIKMSQQQIMEIMEKNPNHLFTIEELAEILGANKHAIRNWLKKLNQDNWVVNYSQLSQGASVVWLQFRAGSTATPFEDI